MKRVVSLVLSFLMLFSAVFSGNVIPAKKAEAAAPAFRNVMYYGEWSIYAGQKNFTVEKIAGNYITHLNFAFLDVDENGNVISCDTWADFENPNVGYSTTSDSPWAGVAPAMILLRNQYPNMKIGFSVGGWTRSGDFPAVAASETKRRAFAQNIAKIAHLYGYDFVDIDWEYPTADRDPDPNGNGVTVDKGCKGSAADKHNFTLLLQELRNALNVYDAIDNKHYELSVAMSASPAMMAQIEYDQVLNIVDFANMMTYDLNGAWNAYTGHQTALFTNEAYNHTTQVDGQFSVNTCVKYLYDTYGSSIDPSKIVVGIAPYTRGWAGVQNDGPDSNNPGLFATAQPNSVKAADGTTSGTFAYSDIGSLVNQYGLQEYYDETAQAAYYYSPSTGYFFTCDNSRSVAAKAEYVKNGAFKNPFNRPLGGLISWMASLDAASAITKTSHDALFGENTTLPSQNIVFTPMENVSASVAVSGNDYVITINNRNTVSTPKTQGTLHGGAEANVLYYAENFAGTATYPKFYIKTSDGATLSGSSWSAGGTIGTSGDYTTVQYGNWPYYLGPANSQYSTLTLTLTSSTTPDVSKITEIGMTRKASASGTEYGYTVLYGGSGSTPVIDTTAAQTQAPTQAQTQAPTQAQTQAPTQPQTQATTQAQTQPQTQSGGNGGQTYPAWSPDNVSYSVGDIVAYENTYYECTYAHNSNSGWTPTAAVTLWRARTDIPYNGTSGGNGGSGETEPESQENNYYVNSVLPDHIITGYWHNFCNGAANLKLIDVPTYYDLICVAFANSTTTAGRLTFDVDTDLSNALGGYSKAQFIQDIKDLKARGQHVIISVGGAEGTTYVNSNAAASEFASSLISIIEEYGFEGVDIDFEGAAVSGTNYIASALRTVHNHFGDDFIITMAPEVYYMQSTTSTYFKLALEIKDILTVVNAQYYNSGSMVGYGGGIYSQGTVDFLTALGTAMIESGLRPDQIGFGVPSSTRAAGGGYIEPNKLKEAVNCMVYGTPTSGSFMPPRTYPAFRGIMTWSINWDATNNYAWASAMDSTIAGLPATGHEQPTQPQTQPQTQAPTEAPTQAPSGSYDLIVTGINQQINGSQVVFSATVKNNGNAAVPAGLPIGISFSINGVSDVTWCDNFTSGLNAGASVTLTANSGTSAINYITLQPGTYSVTAWVDDVNRFPDESNEDNNKLTATFTVPSQEQPTQAQTQPQTQEQPTQGSNDNPTTGLASRLLIGYYHTWDNQGNPFIKLRDVDPNWDVINISFAVPVSAGSTDGRMQFNISGLSASYTKADFKQDVKTLQAAGKKVVLSIGGYEGYFSLGSQAAVNQFVSDIKAIVDEYGFDGIDIDLEQTSVQFNSGNDPDINNPTSPKIVNMINAIRTIVSSYGDDFILSWAPETFYVQLGYQYYGGINQYCDSRAGDYLPMINALRDVTSYVHVQLYNSSPMIAPDGVSYNMGTKEGIVAMCKMLLDGFYVNNYYTTSKTPDKYFAPLRPDQVAIGVPSSSSAAGSGQVANSVLQAAFTELNSAYPGIRGIMTWSINWDSSQNNNSFAQSNGAFLDTFMANDPQPETQPATQPQTQAPVTEPQTQAPETQPQGQTTTVHIEAEDFASVTGGVNVPSKQYEASHYITGFAKGDSASYNVTVADSGIYTVDIRASIKYAGTKKVNVYVDGTLLTTVDIQSTGSFATFQTFSSEPVYIAAGQHTIKLEAAGAAGYAINWIELKGSIAAPETQAPETQAPQTQPATQPQGQTTTVHIEAEDYASATGGVNVPSKKYEDSKYITGFAKGDSASYDVSVADSGIYTVDIRASIKYVGTKTVNVYADGALLTTVDIQSTGSFATFQTFSSEPVYIAAGSHTIKLEAAGAAGYAINWIELKGNTAAPETQAETQPQGPTETIHIEAEDFASATGGVNVPAKLYEDSHYITGFAKGDSASYNVTVAGSGNYTVDIRASIKYVGIKMVNVYVDGTLLTTVDIQSTGSFATFQTFSSAPVYIGAGNHTIKLEAAGAAGYAINWIELKGN
ncbi:MAG: carbohydrate-binding protein, partial [Lachnospiraceae bacterium]|nr:carbohydrate-binding protein [Lachnospiraceae bacterium]